MDDSRRVTIDEAVHIMQSVHATTRKRMVRSTTQQGADPPGQLGPVSGGPAGEGPKETNDIYGDEGTSGSRGDAG